MYYSDAFNAIKNGGTVIALSDDGWRKIVTIDGGRNQYHVFHSQLEDIIASGAKFSVILF
jgi:hypothetical protein